MNTRTHWQGVYRSNDATAVSWYQANPTVSLKLIRHVVKDSGAAIIDIGGRTSTLVDHLLDAGFRSVTVLDVSADALHQAQQRLGPRAELVTWLEMDVLGYGLPLNAYDLWHDRAVFTS